MAGKLVILGSILVLLAGETIYFARQYVAAVQRLRGQQAFFRNDHEDAWRRYQSALAWGGDPDQVEADEIELLLFGLDQMEAGARVHAAMPPDQAVRRALALAARRVRALPHNARYWSLASDVFFHEARQRRRETPLDITQLSEDPLLNLTREEWRGVLALEIATHLEPNNYMYQDLLVEFFLEIGSPAQAAVHCRRALAAFPRLDDHPYLKEAGLSPEILEAAVEGFQDATLRESMVSEEDIDCDTARLLLQNGRDEDALPHLDRAIAASPRSFLPRYLRGDVRYRMKTYREAIGDLEIAAGLKPDDPWPHYLLGRAHLALGEREAAVSAMRRAKEIASGDLQFYLGLGEALEQAGQLPEAERQFVAAANLNSRNPSAWWALLGYYERHPGSNASDVCSRLQSLLPYDTTIRMRCSRLGQAVR